MAVILLVMVLSLLTQGILCTTGETDKGCMKWFKDGDNVCCEACHPGQRLVSKCGSKSKDLCTPCEPGTYTVNALSDVCSRCTQCVGALFMLEACTATKDTKCGCKEGLVCGNVQCSHCVEKCEKGHEPTDNRSCRPCPKGTFNDQIHQKCKPFSKTCPNPGEYIHTKGDAYSDIKCTKPTMIPSHKPQPDNNEQGWMLALLMLTSMFLMAIVIIIIAAALKIRKKRKKTIKTVIKAPIIRTPTDDPRTLIAIECSFHEAQQEQGSSTESLDSKDSSDQLIA